MDQVANHCGSDHWWMKDLPFEDWVNYQARFEAGEKPVFPIIREPQIKTFMPLKLTPKK